MVDNCWRIRGQARSHDGRRALIGMPGAGRHRRQGKREAGASRQPGSSVSGSQGPGAPKKRNYRPRRITGQQPEGSCRLASRPISPGAVSRLAGASQVVYDPGSKKAPCRSLTADKFEASHCLLQSLVSVS